MELSFSFGRELREQHDAVRATARWLQAELDRAADLHEESFVHGPLRAFRHELGEHFRFEERGGFGGACASSDPEIRACCGRLLRQHGEFERRLDALLMRLESLHGLGQVLPPELLADLRCFFDDLARHDAEENALAQGQTQVAQLPKARS